MLSLAADAAASSGGFQWVNLALLLVVVAVGWPFYQRLRRRISQDRRERWAREDAEEQAALQRRDEGTDSRPDDLGR